MDEFPSHSKWNPIVDPEWEGSAGKRIKDELARKQQLEDERIVRVRSQPFCSRAVIPDLPIPDTSDLMPMPVLTISDARRLLSGNLFTDKDQLKLFVQVDSSAELEHLEKSDFFKEVLKSLDEFQLGAFDIEGKPEATALLIGDLNGVVVAINNLSSTGIPQSLKARLENRNYRWVGSMIEGDVEQLRKYAEVAAWIDTAFVYRGCVQDEPDNRFGRGAQAEFVGQEDFPYCKKLASGKMVYLCKFGSDAWGMNERRHAAQDVRVPLAFILKSTIAYMLKYDYFEDANVMPFLNNLLHTFTNLHHRCQPVLSRFRPEEFPWLPQPEIQNQKVFVGGTLLVHDLNRITAERRSFNQFCTELSTPLFEDPPTPYLNSYKSQAEKNWELIFYRMRVLRLPGFGSVGIAEENIEDVH
jgi:hypothetical protein